MITTTITLTEQENTLLQSISQQSGKSQEDLLHDAVNHYIEQFQEQKRRMLLQQARGIWHNRTDLPTLAQLRSEFER